MRRLSRPAERHTAGASGEAVTYIFPSHACVRHTKPLKEKSSSLRPLGNHCPRTMNMRVNVEESRVLASHFMEICHTVKTEGPSTAVIVCNWELPDITPVILQNASAHVCADGGANRLYDQLPLLFPGKDPDSVRQEYLPHVIAGDLDSIRDEVRNYYETMGVRIINLSHDQDSTDLMKCVEVISNLSGDLYSCGRVTPPCSGAYDAIIALGAQGGRLDHTLGHLSVLHMYRDLPLVLLGDKNMTRLVQKGKAIIRPSKMEGPKCGLVPLTGDATASSSGLQWNLENTTMRMGGLVSTSNHIIDRGNQNREVFIETDSDLIWTVELQY